ncbi:hypothetical protein BH11PSE11_BH11PSE11_12210 [soil metagenome]
MLNDSSLYAVSAEAEGHDRPLLQLDLTFARLMDDIVVPYQSQEPFFIDGAPLTAAKLRRIKILRLGETFLDARETFARNLTRAGTEHQKLYGSQYAIRFEHLLRENAEDVTSQVIKAYIQVIKPSIKDYTPKREELISGAFQMFIQGIKLLSD